MRARHSFKVVFARAGLAASASPVADVPTWLRRCSTLGAGGAFLLGDIHIKLRPGEFRLAARAVDHGRGRGHRTRMKEEDLLLTIRTITQGGQVCGPFQATLVFLNLVTNRGKAAE